MADPITGALGRFAPGDEVAIAVFVHGGAAVTPADAPERTAEVGPISFEMTAECLAHRPPRDAARRGVALLRIDPWPRRGHLMGLEDRIVALTLDERGVPRIARRRFESVEAATDALAGHGGEWLIVRGRRARLRPRLASLDPLSREVAVEGSWIGLHHGEPSGVFAGDVAFFDEWILDHYPSRYSGVAVLERRILVERSSTEGDVEAAAEIDAPSAGGDWFVIGEVDGAPRRVARLASEADARAHVRGRPGRWLVARLDHRVDLR